MLEKLKTILKNIREERQSDLEMCISNSVFLNESRRAILSLELPHKIDSFSVCYAEAVVHKAKVSVLAGYNILQVDYKPGMKGSLVFKRTPQRFKDLAKIDIFLEKWINAADSPDASLSRRMLVVGVIKKAIESFCEKNPQERLKLEELHYILTLEAMSLIINGQDVERHIKELYLSLAQNFIDFFRGEFAISSVLIGRRSRLSLNDAAAFFEYLENRALRSTTVQKFNDLLLCRALFYAPLPEKKFFELAPPSECQLKSGDNVFYVPETFFRLWKGFSRPNLFERTFDDRQLHKKIQRLGKYAGLKIDSLTPSVLRLSGESAYRNYLSLNDDVVAFLPKRD